MTTVTAAVVTSMMQISLPAGRSGRRCYVLDVNIGRVLEMIGRQRLWKLQSMITAILGALIAKKLIRGAFRLVRKDKAPDAVFDPTSARFSWPDVVVWAAAAGIGLGVAKVVSARVAAIGWEVATGTPPPGSTSERSADAGGPPPALDRRTPGQQPKLRNPGFKSPADTHCLGRFRVPEVDRGVRRRSERRWL